MTMTADGTTNQLGQGDARDTLLEMAAVIRAVFGVGLEATRRTTDTIDAEVEQAVVTPASTYAAPASIPMPGLPVVAAPQERPTVPAAPTPYAGEVPSLRVSPSPVAPLDDVLPEHRQAVLREVAFLDD